MHPSPANFVPPSTDRPPGEVVRNLTNLIAAGRRFATLMADPPWPYQQSPRGAAARHYRTLSLPELAALPVGRLALPDSHLHLWATHSFLRPAVDLMAGWGFAYRSLLVWVKPQLGTGFYWRSSCEFLLLGVRGRRPFRDRSVPNWLCVPRGRHSEKPSVFRSLVELVSDGPRLELFARTAAPGWTAFGDELAPADEAGRPVPTLWGDAP